MKSKEFLNWITNCNDRVHKDGKINEGNKLLHCKSYNCIIRLEIPMRKWLKYVSKEQFSKQKPIKSAQNPFFFEMLLKRHYKARSDVLGADMICVIYFIYWNGYLFLVHDSNMERIYLASQDAFRFDHISCIISVRIAHMHVS